MKKTFKKKLSLRKETIASLNDSQQMLIFGGNADASDVTFCQTNCPACGGGGGGGGGNNLSYTCYEGICTIWSWIGNYTCPC